MSEKTVMDIVTEDLKADLCQRCVHGTTCKYYETLKSAIEKERNLSTVFDMIIIANIASDALAVGALEMDIVERNAPFVPVVGIISCGSYKIISK